MDLGKGCTALEAFCQESWAREVRPDSDDPLGCLLRLSHGLPWLLSCLELSCPGALELSDLLCGGISKHHSTSTHISTRKSTVPRVGGKLLTN